MMSAKDSTTRLFRPVGRQELDLVRHSGFRAFPPRLEGQPIFYPVLTFEYAEKIARDWNVGDSGYGAVLAFHVRDDFLVRYEIRTVGGRAHQEYWIPAAQLAELNQNIVGTIEVVAEYGSEPKSSG
jgi:hypothetical protein